jgi:hypothetical protein
MNINPAAAKVTVGDAAGAKHQSSAQADLKLNLPSHNAKILPSFNITCSELASFVTPIAKLY